jgi:hypothetical protein
MKKHLPDFLPAVLLAGIMLMGCPMEEDYMPEIPAEVVGIEITKLPDKTTYEQDGGFDTSGLMVTALYDDGSKKNVTGRISFSAWRMDLPGKQTITVSFEGWTAKYSIWVVPVEPQEPK